MSEARHLSIYIDRAPGDVYAFAADPRNLPRWAAGLARSCVQPAGEWWIVDAPFGTARVHFAPPNPFGVMDHDVVLADGTRVHNPMRVVPNGAGSEFIFTLLRAPATTDEQFAADACAVERDLRALKTCLES